MIRGLHAMFYSSQAEELRAFFRDKLGFHATDVGDGWLIFDIPEADLGVHPTRARRSAVGDSGYLFLLRRHRRHGGVAASARRRVHPSHRGPRLRPGHAFQGPRQLHRPALPAQVSQVTADRLSREEFNRPTLQVARGLIGTYIVRNINGRRVSAMIAETEAYKGPRDAASHAYGGRRTARVEPLIATAARCTSISYTACTGC